MLPSFVMIAARKEYLWKCKVEVANIDPIYRVNLLFNILSKFKPFAELPSQKLDQLLICNLAKFEAEILKD